MYTVVLAARGVVVRVASDADTVYTEKAIINRHNIKEIKRFIITSEGFSTHYHKTRTLIIAGVEGLEPSRTVLETVMLPLHHIPIRMHPHSPAVDQRGS